MRIDKSLLVVEDDKFLSRAIESTLTDAGFSVQLARNSKEALEVLQNNHVDLVYLDLMLPGEMDGFEILRTIRNTPELKDLPVVILSNLGQMKEIDRAMEIGANDYVVKANMDLEKIVELSKKKLNIV